MVRLEDNRSVQTMAAMGKWAVVEVEVMEWEEVEETVEDLVVGTEDMVMGRHFLKNLVKNHIIK